MPSGGGEILILWALLGPAAAFLIGYRIGKGAWE